MVAGDPVDAPPTLLAAGDTGPQADEADASAVGRGRAGCGPAEMCHPALRPGRTAAFSVAG
ncbi:hypothetical protein ABT063_38530 [Streptomyces sp. NPDC002838]|uniref:hypothetical protein n=1 Tax=Streptomyces sp. NPDC002838 TaxID=3154436 RepID=UPI00332B9862